MSIYLTIFLSTRFTFPILLILKTDKNEVKPEKHEMDMKRYTLGSLENPHYELELCLAQTNILAQASALCWSLCL